MGPVAALWTTGAVPEGALTAGLLEAAVVALGPTGVPADALAVRLGPVPARWTSTAEPLGEAAAFWTRTGALPVPAAVVPAGAGTAAGTWGTPVGRRTSTADSPPGLTADGGAAGVPTAALWTVAGRVMGLLGPVAAESETAFAAGAGAGAGTRADAGAAAGVGAAPAEPALARWTLSAGSLVRVTALPGPAAVLLPDADAVVAAGRTGPAGVGLPVRAGVLGELALVRWTLSAGPPERATVLPGSAEAGSLGPVGVGLPARAGVLPEPALARWTLSAGSLVRVTALPGLAPVPALDVVAVAGRTGSAGVGSLGPVGVGLPARAGVAAGPVAGARWTLTAGPLERATVLPGLLPVPPASTARLLEPAAVAAPDADVAAVPAPDAVVAAGRTGSAGVGSLGPVGAGLPVRAGAAVGPVAGARWTLTAVPAAGALAGAPAPGEAAPEAVAPDFAAPAVEAVDATDFEATDPEATDPDGPGPSGAGPGEAGPTEAAPGSPVAVGAEADAGTGADTGTGADADAGRWATGRARRCTAGVAGALVSGLCRWGLGGTAVTRGPVGRDAVTGRDARCTGGASPTAGDGAAPGTSGPATGRTRDGGSSPATGPADVVSAFLISPPGAPSRTAWDRVPVREGFCQVLSRPPKPESATPVRPRAARWIGGSPVQPTTAAGPAPTEAPETVAPVAAVPMAVVPEAVVPVTTAAGTAPAPVPVPVSACAPAGAERAADVAVPPLSRSRNPTDQPSAPPRVTRDAICSV
ncbi:hypothetical protein [Streptomyces sp. NPDC017991]|uniref:hypothetical protein n=1 Tax=Streptomyces sp. NPDC017991 TaxID=3365026 RepID=UPI00378C03AF